MTKPDTLNHKTLEPVPRGLFCPVIFGPVEDYRCACGKLVGQKHAGLLCFECGVTVGLSIVRSKNLGHVDLAVPCVHPWLERVLCAVLGWTDEERRSVESYEKVVHFDDGTTARGGRAIERLLATANNDVARALRESGTDPSLLVITALPVMPPGLRPRPQDDAVDLYRRVINRNNRLVRLEELNAPDDIVVREGQMLHEAVKTLFDNERCARPVMNADGRPLVSIGTMLLRALENESDATILLESMNFLTTPESEAVRRPRSEYEITLMPDGLREWDKAAVESIDAALSRVGSGEVMHLVDVQRIHAFEAGGPATWSVAFVPIGDDHLFVTYGNSGRVEPARGGITFELSIRVPARTSGIWPGMLLRQLVRYMRMSGRELRVEDFMTLPTPITRVVSDSDDFPATKMDTIFIFRDPVLPAIDTRRGTIEVRRVVGLHPRELAAIASVREKLPNLETDIARESLTRGDA